MQGVASGTILTVDRTFTQVNDDIELRRYGDAACTNQVDSGTTSSDNETVTATNSSGGALDYCIRIDR